METTITVLYRVQSAGLKLEDVRPLKLDGQIENQN